MKQIEPFDVINIANFNKRTALFYKFLQKFLKFKKYKQLYSNISYKEGLEFIDSVLETLNLQLEFNEEDLQKIPHKGPFIIVSNFPLGGIEALVLLKVISKVRSDFRILSTIRYHQMQPLETLTIPMSEDVKNDKMCLTCAKAILKHLNEGNSIGVFPAGKASTFKGSVNKVVDKKWDKNIVKLIKKSKVPIIPVFFNDSYSRLFYLFGNLHPVLQAFLINKELENIEDKVVNLRIGSVIKPQELDKFTESSRLTKFLRARIYALSAKSNLNVDTYFKYKTNMHLTQAEDLIAPINPEILNEQIESAKENFLLYSQSNFEIICAPPQEIPEVLTEIGRLREKTFRSVGEGTNKSLDLDEFDIYYNHLVIWDNTNKKIVGAYRIGRGDEIIDRYSITGFYVNTLFKMKKELIPMLRQSLEMGRSFIVEEYQKKPLSLFLLWKGILYFLLKNPQYRYLLGPVSISQEFSELTKNLIVNIIRTHYWNYNLAKYIRPRRKYKVIAKDVDKKILLFDIGNDLNKLDKYVQEIEPGTRMPVLIKKYMGLGAKIAAFNVDPLFNYCLDGMLILDIFDIPSETLKTLAKDLNDNNLLDRFNIGN